MENLLQETPKELLNLRVSPNAIFHKITVIIPVHNEIRTISTILNIVTGAPVSGLQKEVIVIDDCSTDGTREKLKEYHHENVKVIFHEKNTGKGGALHTGFKHATGDIIIIQDADLEYDPHEYESLIKPFLYEKADIVYGSRYLKHNSRQVHRYWHTMFNKLFTHFSNMLSNTYLTDVQTCYKVFNRKVLEEVALKIESKRFGFEPEFAARIARRHYKIIEVPISYYPRSYALGKHIGLKDAFEGLWIIVKYNLFRRDL
jgi:glycosyltransferase involved in cell wall biosynthesis